MKKILSLLALSCLSMAAWAAVQPEAGKLYKMHCAALDGHETSQYLQYSTNGNVTYNSARGSYFMFEQGDSEGKWYIKEAGSGKYLVVTDNNVDTAITLSEDHTTYWTTTEQSDGIRFLPNGTAGVFMNNNKAFALKAGTGGCSSWVLEEQADVAKGATSADAIETGWYKIELGDGTGANHAAHKGKYITGKVTFYNNNNWGMSFSQDPENDPSAWIYVEKGTGDNYTFTFNKGTRNEYTIGQNSIVNTTAGNFQFGAQTASADNFQFTIWGGGNYIVGYTLSGLEFVGNTTTAGTNNVNKSCYYVFHKVEAPQITEVAYTYKCDGIDDAVVYEFQTNGSAFAAPVVPPFGEVVSVVGEGTVSSTNNTCVVNYTQTLPFVLGNVYYLGDRLIKTGDTTGNIQYYSYGDAADKKVPSRAGSPQFAKNYMWTIERVANTFDEFYLKNLEFGYVSTADGNSNQSVLGENKTAMKLYEYTGDGHQTGNKDFGFTDAAVPTNVFGDHASSHLGYWKPGLTGNEGSAFRVVDIDFGNIPTDVTDVTDHKGYVTGGYTIVWYNIQNTDDLITAALNPTEENVMAILNTKTEETISRTISYDKYYRLVDFYGRYPNAAPNANAEGVMQDSNRNVADNANKADVSSLWQFTEDNHIVHVNSGLCLGQPSKGANVALTLSSENAGVFTVAQVSGDNFKHTIKYNNIYLNTNNTITRVDGWDADGDGSRWYIVEAESVPVVVSEVGYTTINLPVAVTIPDEVNAYKVTAETETSMLLEEVSGDVAAYTPLIIEATAKTYDFNIAATGTDVSGNLLSGTTARRTGFGENSFYALAADGDAVHGVSFKKNGNVDAIPANKAYLTVATSSNKALYLDFGDEATGINAVEALPATDALYNINGQRVVAPTRGIYVKANGQKVFIK